MPSAWRTLNSWAVWADVLCCARSPLGISGHMADVPSLMRREGTSLRMRGVMAHTQGVRHHISHPLGAFAEPSLNATAWYAQASLQGFLVCILARFSIGCCDRFQLVTTCYLQFAPVCDSDLFDFPFTPQARVAAWYVRILMQVHDT
jgi:hypothetical protein